MASDQATNRCVGAFRACIIFPKAAHIGTKLLNAEASKIQSSLVTFAVRTVIRYVFFFARTRSYTARFLAAANNLIKLKNRIVFGIHNITIPIQMSEHNNFLAFGHNFLKISF